jgi:hypothetical protein
MGSIPPEVILSAPAYRAGKLCVTYQLGDGQSGIWWLDETTLDVVETRPAAVTPLPASCYVPQDAVHAEARTQILPELYRQPARHFLRWEALPICRDEAVTGASVNSGRLCLLSLPETCAN